MYSDIYIPRQAETEILERLRYFPLVAIIGPRQCGKSTLAQKILSRIETSLYLDLELPSDLRKLDAAEQFLSFNSDRLVCLDEIQRKPALFPLLRSLSDKQKKEGQFLILGSASPELLKQSSDSLAGRISYIQLTPFRIDELAYSHFQQHWLRGGYPASWLTEEDHISLRWRYDFISTYLERDIPSLGISLNSHAIRRLWTMLAHMSGQLVNKEKLGNALGISAPTVQRYLEMLENTFMIRILEPWHLNLKKRLIKTPKVYIRDTGIMHALLEIESFNTLMGHPAFGQSWESYVCEQIIAALPEWKPHFYRTSSGAEIDLLMIRGQRSIAVECKTSTAPVLSPGFFHCLEDLKPESAWVICPFKQKELYPHKNDVRIASLDAFLENVTRLEQSE